jgi:Eco57I restriction-modification methylase
MPFLFEKIDDETELLLPDNLLHSDSLIRKLANEIDEEDWQEVEIIGWLYQFYISEKKDQVIGKVVASEDIPAATQLFTPNWIVKYLVQNTLGRQWLATYPQSALRQQMAYYIEPAEQTPEVQEQLKAITPTSLNPEELTLLDPACGSGHILVEAYDLFKAIYQERGYRARDIPALILRKNLFGLEIDDQAAQLAAFALMMKARADDRRIFDSEAKPNILAFQDSRGMDAADITHALNAPIDKEAVPKEYLFEEIGEEKAGLFGKKNLAIKGDIAQADIAQADIAHLIDLFEQGKTFGSLIRVPEKLAEKLPVIAQRVEEVLAHSGMFESVAARSMKPLVEQARILAGKYDAVLTNPPYLGSKGMNSLLKAYAKRRYSDYKADTFAMFIARAVELATPDGHVGLMTPFVWMFISTYHAVRKLLVEEKSIQSLVHPEYHAFFDSAYVPICCFIANNFRSVEPGQYFDLRQFYGGDLQPVRFREAIRNPECGWRYSVPSADFAEIPGEPIVYWLPRSLRSCFSKGTPLEQLAEPRIGMATCDNDTFLRRWSEVSLAAIGFGCASRPDAIESRKKWFPHHKGGDFRRWYGNLEYVVNWENDGHLLQTTKHPIADRVRAHNFNLDQIFKPALVWTSVTSASPSFRISEQGFLYDAASGLCPVKRPSDVFLLLGILNNKLVQELQPALNPTLNLVPGDLCRIPVVKGPEVSSISEHVGCLVTLSKLDWNLSETAWDFHGSPLVAVGSTLGGLSESFTAHEELCQRRMEQTKALEEENNRLILEMYELSCDLSPDVPEDQITLYRPNREEDIKRLLSYAMGCMMGRYSLDKPGLIYAHSGNQGFDPSQYKTFRADDNGIIPQFETEWGIRDDAVNRIVEFIGVAWPTTEHTEGHEKNLLEENLKFIADSLGPTGGEQPRDTIRRYFAIGFYKHHLSMYKKRPIYWLFSSGKQRAFQCLVYLHRYHESTLSRMRIEYVIPLQGKIASRIGQLADDIAAAISTSHRKKLEKERDTLVKQQAELRTFDEKLRHYADKRINLDLDDGVKVNHGRFGDLLAEVKAVTGGAEEL